MPPSSDARPLVYGSNHRALSTAQFRRAGQLATGDTCWPTVCSGNIRLELHVTRLGTTSRKSQDVLTFEALLNVDVTREFITKVIETSVYTMGPYSPTRRIMPV